MGAKSKKASVTRTAAEFDIRRLSLEIQPPKFSSGAYAWTLEEIRGARDLQMLGNFRLPAQLADSIRTDDAIFAARSNRLAPQRAVEVQMLAPKKARAGAISGEAEALYGAKGIALTQETISDVHSCLADHNVAFACGHIVPREDGSRWDLHAKYWPIRWVRYDSTQRCFVTQVDGGHEEPIIHGDGRWIVFSKNEVEPFKHAALLPASMVWARHAFAIRDWAKGSVAHGNAKVIGELPAGIPLRSDDGEGLSPDALAYLELLKVIAGADSPFGIRPSGAKTDFLVNGSTAWQVFDELVKNGEKAAARVYLGTDGMLGASGGAPGVDIQALFGVSRTLVEGDLECLEHGFKTGLIDPWCAINFGDSSLAPTRKYMIPDADADARRTSYRERMAGFFESVEAARKNGFDLTPEFTKSLARKFGVVAPDLKTQSAPAAAASAPKSVPLRRVAR